MKLFRYFIIVLITAASTSCASIVTRSAYPVDFDSDPQGAQLSIENRDGFLVFSGRTPTTVYLEAAAGYMRPERYKITYTQNGREPVTAYIHGRLNGWYFGNLLLGGWIGMLVIDPMTGAMYRIPSGSKVVNMGTGASARETPSSPPAAPEGGWTPLGE